MRDIGPTFHAIAHRGKGIRPTANTTVVHCTPVVTPAGSPLFYVLTALVKILNRDLAAAGIAKGEDRGRTIDVHAMRHTFATHLVAAGVAPRVAQAALRHSSLELTMQLYTDLRLLDVAGVLDRLPALSGVESMPEATRATGTHDTVPVALPVALNPDARCVRESIRDSFDDRDVERSKLPNENHCRESREIPDSSQVPSTRIELVTFSSGG